MMWFNFFFQKLLAFRWVFVCDFGRFADGRDSETDIDKKREGESQKKIDQVNISKIYRWIDKKNAIKRINIDSMMHDHV